MNKLLLARNIILLFVFVFPILVSSECTCDRASEGEGSGEDQNKSRVLALKYKLVAVASILIAGAIGVSLPILGRFIPAFHPEKDIFFVIKAFAAGVILATGFVHVLPDAFESLNSPCLPEDPWGNFPFSGLIAMLSGIGALMVDVFVTSYFNRSHINKPQPGVPLPLWVNVKAKLADDEEKVQQQNLHVHTHSTHGHSHGSAAAYPAEPSEDSSALDLIRRRVISQVLELGIVVHSVIIGVSLGASESPKTIKPLVAALTFHQMFEGMGLGGCISQANFKSRTIAVMAIFFSLTTPIGIAIGFGISKIYDENSPTALIVQGVFNSASAGILIYMALVDLLAADLMSPKMQTRLKLQFASNLSLLLGAGCMSLLAKWA